MSMSCGVVRCRARRVVLFRAALAALVSGFFGAGAQGSIQLNPIPAGSATVAFEGNAAYSRAINNFSHPGLPSTIVTKTFGPGMSNIVFDNVTFTASDLDFVNAAGIGNGFRWSERVFNNTGAAWTSFTMSLSETTAQFITGVSFGPASLVTINGGAPILAGGPNTIVSDDLVGNPNSLGQAVLSAGNQVVTFNFNSPVLPGTFVDLYAPIGLLPHPGTAVGSFQLAQSAVAAVPEAASIAMWSVLSLTVGGGMWVRRRWAR